METSESKNIQSIKYSFLWLGISMPSTYQLQPKLFPLMYAVYFGIINFWNWNWIEFMVENQCKSWGKWSILIFCHTMLNRVNIKPPCHLFTFLDHQNLMQSIKVSEIKVFRNELYCRNIKINITENRHFTLPYLLGKLG